MLCLIWRQQFQNNKYENKTVDELKSLPTVSLFIKTPQSNKELKNSLFIFFKIKKIDLHDNFYGKSTFSVPLTIGYFLIR